ncbi:endolytic transglycosylase MltG [Scleromatobacter humisilvae]|uniref:Endolytic murein transglycosylase n=1 Tax=Scleromatobacter humisilvae TaxID=2897159 RepID=A0A9X1YK41_9BURK|nr:endolytic transglycosylase MltG [Scleromatobacter humisilvae]MCK9686308.1 endolytic transglycosylase MltG [Scleromatobacter humisilvae]
MFKRFLFLLIVLAAAAAGAAFWWLEQPLRLAHDEVEVSIEPGTPVREIVRLWHDAGVDEPPELMYQWFRWSGEAKRIRAGSYLVDKGATPRSLLRKMVVGDEELESVHIIDGWTVKQMRAALAAADGLKPTTAGMTDEQLMAAIGSPDEKAEGRFFPDTYVYSKGVKDILVLKRAHDALERQLQAAWALRAPDTPLKSADEALALASVIEKETGAASDRGKVAAVFSNRLRLGMPLQSDPTVIYGMGAAYDGNIHKADLQTDTPYNSYTRQGLPPTPIALPGRDALRAAVRPDASKALYFVSRGDGTSVFSETLNAHNAAVNQYIRGPHK